MRNVFLVLCLFALVLPASALDRQAFTFTGYDLQARLEPWQQRLGMRGRITLRNDSPLAQRSLVLQISSTLNWSSIQLQGRPLPFVSQAYTSDIDHSGGLTEAIVTLPGPIAPTSTVELEIGYEGVIPQDSTRLARIGMPLASAQHSDWDRISNSFSIVRGIGYVAWYPIATEAVLLKEGNAVFEEVGRWQHRESEAEMKISFCLSEQNPALTVLMNGPSSELSGSSMAKDSELDSFLCSSHTFSPLGLAVPTFAVANYEKAEKPDVDLYYLPGHRSWAENYALAVEETAPVVKGWFGEGPKSASDKAQAVELPDSEASPFAAGNMLLLPASADDSVLLLSALQQLTQKMVSSPRAWIFAGLPGYAQVNYLELRRGREAAIRYLENHRAALVQAEKQADGHEPGRTEPSLVSGQDEFYVEAKAMYVWWMLKDMLGDNALHAALRAYRPGDDRDQHYMEKLIETHSHRDLGWFFDDWVYHDRGLPDFRVVSVYPRPQGNGAYLVTVTVENLGGAGAEVPVTVHALAGEKTERLTVPGGAKATVRILVASTPREVTVNDGSIPEMGVSNRPYPIAQVSDSK